MLYAHGKNRHQNPSHYVLDVAGCVIFVICAVLAFPPIFAAVTAATVIIPAFWAGNTLARYLMCTHRPLATAAARMYSWRKRRTGKAREFCLAGIPKADKTRFKAELMRLCGEMAREAARANRGQTGEGTQT
jgi:hypothetical protein